MIHDQLANRKIDEIAGQLNDFLCEMFEVRTYADMYARKLAYIRPTVEIGGPECPEGSAAYDLYWRLRQEFNVRCLLKAAEQQ